MRVRTILAICGALQVILCGLFLFDRHPSGPLDPENTFILAKIVDFLVKSVCITNFKGVQVKNSYRGPDIPCFLI